VEVAVELVVVPPPPVPDESESLLHATPCTNRAPTDIAKT
jgi:hypothetical protein